MTWREYLQLAGIGFLAGLVAVAIGLVWVR
jgi:hypothetical protein